MTVGQYEKATNKYREIRSIKYVIDGLLKNDKSVVIKIDDLSGCGFVIDQAVGQQVKTFLEINEAAIRAELLDMMKDHLAKLEDELKEI